MIGTKVITPVNQEPMVVRKNNALTNLTRKGSQQTPSKHKSPNADLYDKSLEVELNNNADYSPLPDFSRMKRATSTKIYSGRKRSKSRIKQNDHEHDPNTYLKRPKMRSFRSHKNLPKVSQNKKLRISGSYKRELSQSMLKPLINVEDDFNPLE